MTVHMEPKTLKNGLHRRMEEQMQKDRWHVIYEDRFREKIADGWSVLVLCAQDAERIRSSWVGQWQVFCVSPDRADRLIVVQKKNMDPKVILSAHGVTSFLMDLGITVAAVPMVKGETVEITHDGQVLVGHDPN